MRCRPAAEVRICQICGAVQGLATAAVAICSKWVWVNTYRYIFSGMNIHKSQLFWGSLGTRVLTHPQIMEKTHGFSDEIWAKIQAGQRLQGAGTSRGGIYHRIAMVCFGAAGSARETALLGS